MTRRTVLKWGGVTAGSAIVATGGVAGVRSVTNGAFTAGEGAPYELWHGWASLTGRERIATAGMLAANPHNTQPWRYHWPDNERTVLTIATDPSRTMPVNDPRSREHQTGLGCAIENVAIAAREQALDTRVALERSDESLVATLRFAPGAKPSATDLALAAAIPNRHTNRGAYSERRVGQEMLDSLNAGWAGRARILWITETDRKRELSRLYVEQTEAIIHDEPQSREAFSWFRNDRGDVDRYRDGLTLDCQGLDSVTLALAKILPAQSRESGDQFWLKSTRDLHTKTAAAYGVVIVDDHDADADRIEGGRLFERIHLAAQVAGLAVQPMNQITERIDRERVLGQDSGIADDWSQVLGVQWTQPLMAFRIGYPEVAARPSPRRSVAAVTAA